MFQRLSSRALLPIAALALLACPSPAPVSVEIIPTSATVVVGQSAVFSARVTGAKDTQVEWSVREGPGGGVITAAGLYSAPSVVGLYTVVATSKADPTKSATATVTVMASSQPVAVSVSPSAVTLGAGRTQVFSATVTGSDNVTVDWSVEEGANGGTVSAGGLYTAPQAAGTFHVLATSRAEPSKVARATVTVTANPVVSVSISPSQVSLSPSAAQTFTATVSGTSNSSVLWSVQEGIAGGTVSSTGQYTAPQVPGTYHVVATSEADPTKSASATITVTAPPAISVSVSPSSAKLQTYRTQRFTATVTNTNDKRVRWSVDGPPGGGSITSTGDYTAPGSAGTYVVRATSEADPSKSGTATVTVTPSVQVTVQPYSVSLQGGQTQQFSATVTGASNPAVTWSVTPAGGGTISASGLYTAPATTGTYQVLATSVADPSAQGVASVTVMGAPTTLSGTVTYSGAKTGRIYVVASDSTGGQLGTSLAAAGAFTLRGVQRPGTYTVRAFMDTLETQHQSGASPVGSATVQFSGSPVSGVTVALADPPARTLTAPTAPYVFPGSGAAFISLSPLKDTQGNELADHYRIYWSNTASPGPGNNLGSKTIASSNAPAMHVSGLANGSSLYVAVAGVLNGTEGPLSPTTGPVAIGPGSGGTTLTGSVSFAPLTTQGPLVVLAVQYALSSSMPPVFSAVVPSPQSPQSYSLSGLPAGTYMLYAYLDRDNDGELDLTDVGNVFGPGRTLVAVSGTSVTAPTLVLGAGAGRARATTSHGSSGTTGTYTLTLNVAAQEKVPVKVALTGGSGVSGPYDLGLGTSSSPGFNFSLPSSTTAPVLGNSYSFDVTYADGTQGTLSAAVTGVLPRATFSAPSGTTSNRQPTFTWSYPSALPAGATQLLYVYGGSTASWMYLMGASVTSVQWNADGTASSPTLPAGYAGASLQAQDVDGNTSWASVSFSVQ